MVVASQVWQAEGLVCPTRPRSSWVQVEDSWRLLGGVKKKPARSIMTHNVCDQKVSMARFSWSVGVMGNSNQLYMQYSRRLQLQGLAGIDNWCVGEYIMSWLWLRKVRIVAVLRTVLLISWNCLKSISTGGGASMLNKTAGGNPRRAQTLIKILKIVGQSK